MVWITILNDFFVLGYSIPLVIYIFYNYSINWELN